VFITTGGSQQGVTGAVQIKSADAAGSARRRHLLAAAPARSGGVNLGTGRVGSLFYSKAIYGGKRLYASVTLPMLTSRHIINPSFIKLDVIL